jgi:hypothetical protein
MDSQTAMARGMMMDLPSGCKVECCMPQAASNGGQVQNGLCPAGTVTRTDMTR